MSDYERRIKQTAPSDYTVYPQMIKSQPIIKAGEGVKYDHTKPDMTDIPLEAMWEMGAAFTYGQKKYGKNNYRNGMSVSRQLAACVRHVYQHLSGETLDPESGVSHIGHALASLAMACYTLKNHPHLDDRHSADIDKHKETKNAK